MNFLEQSKTSAGISAESAAKARSEISITRRYFADMLILMVVPAVMALVLLRRQSRAPYGAFRTYGRALRSPQARFIFKAQVSVHLSAVATGL